MENWRTVLSALEEQFSVPVAEMNRLAGCFREAMTGGLAGQATSLKMLPAFIGRPTGREQGKFIAVDFGGTNVRALLIELMGQGRSRIMERRSFPLKDKLGRYDYTAATAAGTELFHFIAGKIAEIVPADGLYPLGHTFSFPCRQPSVNEAVLINWTKEIKTAGVEGRNVAQLLQAALDSNGLSHVRSQAVINDTTGTLLAAAYSDTKADIGAILGTGCNSCYLEPCHPLTGQPMIINLEAGNFDGVLQNQYDIVLDEASEKPGAQRLEKMVSGQYLGEIVRFIGKSFAGEGHGLSGLARLAPYSLSTEDLSALLADQSANLNDIATIAANRWGIADLNPDDCQAIQQIAGLVATRSARLAAAAWAGVLLKIDPALKRRHTIAVDGSLYEKMPGYSGYVTQAMQDLYGEKAERITIRLSKDGSGIGAAIAAAVVYRCSTR